MNIFVIPSWYPSDDYPIDGIFIKEQTYSLCLIESDINIGISLWGQKDDKSLLWLRDHVKNIPKILRANLSISSKQVLPNLTEYTSPTLIWTRKIIKGNIRNIIRANLRNLKAFESQYGPVDMLHAHVGYPAGYIAMKIAELMNLPFIITEHMGPFPSPYDSDKNGVLTSFYKRPFLLSKRNIAVSNSLKRKMESMSIPRVQVVPNFVDEDFFVPPNLFQKNKKEFIFFTLASITPEKGIDKLLYAIKSFTSNKEVKFKIGGEGPYSELYKDLCKSLGIDHKVEWLGILNREEALTAYQQADVFILPSLHESMGVVYVEALACGKPIIATRCGGPEDIVNHKNGLLVDVDSSQALVGALQYMIDNIHLYNPTVIRQDFLNRLSKRAVIPKVVRLYQDIISKHSPTP